MKHLSRHRAREAALQILYTWEVGHLGPEEAMSSLPWLEDVDEPIPDDAREFAAGLVRGTIARREELDRLIERHAEHWRLSRMAAIDRLILRLGAYELTSGEPVPAAVVIDEAIELTRRYSEGEAAGFVNGVLDAIHKSRAAAPDPTGGG